MFGDLPLERFSQRKLRKHVWLATIFAGVLQKYLPYFFYTECRL